MQFIPEKKTVATLLSAKKQFEIPRFQREYSWERSQLSEFLDDIIKQIALVDGKLVTSDYFLGTMLFVGNFTSAERKMDVVDGQQRITTVTIFLSVLSALFSKEQLGNLGDKVWGYLISKDDNDQEFAVLKNETPNPFFQRLIQTRPRQVSGPAATEEEERIEVADKFFQDNLKFANLKKRFSTLGGMDISGMNYPEVLKALRDQILGSVIICLCTEEKHQANMIFEVLNAKGMNLDPIDLIKNEIFSVITNEVPTDEAKNYWKMIKANLSPRGYVAMDTTTFFRHYWISKYSKVPSAKLYKEFQKKVRPVSEQNYLIFLKELEEASREYMKIIHPSPHNYGNKRHYLYIPEAYGNINASKTIQPRVVLLALQDARFNRDVLSAEMLKRVLYAIERFHFVFSLMAMRASKLENIYSEFAIDLRGATSKNDANNLAERFIARLGGLLPDYEAFRPKFIELEYVDGNQSGDVNAKYAIYALTKYLEGLDISPNNASIEHIANKSSDISNRHNIGNLLILEEVINTALPPGASFDQKIGAYAVSNFQSVKNFVRQSAIWGEEQIKVRGAELARIFYEKILGKTIPEHITS